MNILFTPARIGSVEIKNRIVMPPMTTRTADDEGFVTEDCIAYYLARARRYRAHHRRNGIAGKSRPASAPRSRDL
jgi:2,4-dienoyl-CoA reductase-like NADH-dependent reductase (Old Yellow Enzyme family)